MTESAPGPSNAGSVVLNVGDGIGALVLHTPADLDGHEIGRGLARYDAGDAAKIAGVKSGDIEAALGFTAGPTLIHADDLALAR